VRASKVVARVEARDPMYPDPTRPASTWAPGRNPVGMLAILAAMRAPR